MCCPSAGWAQCPDIFGPEWTLDVAQPEIGEGALCRRHCRRTGYLGDQNSCCTTGISSDPTKRCRPEYMDLTNPDCNAVMATYCSQGANLFGDRCRAWVTHHAAEADPILKRVCLDPANAGRPECGCIIAADQVSRAKLTVPIPVQCGDNRCSVPNVFKTTSLTAPCTVVNCSLQDVQVLSQQFRDLKINQVCSASGSAAGPPSVAGTDAPTAVGLSTTAKVAIGVSAGLAALLLVGGIVVAARSGRRRFSRVGPNPGFYPPPPNPTQPYPPMAGYPPGYNASPNASPMYAGYPPQQ